MKNRYNPVNPALVARLKEIAGDSALIYGDEEKMEM